MFWVSYPSLFQRFCYMFVSFMSSLGCLINRTTFCIPCFSFYPSVSSIVWCFLKYYFCCSKHSLCLGVIGLVEHMSLWISHISCTFSPLHLLVRCFFSLSFLCHLWAFSYLWFEQLDSWKYWFVLCSFFSVDSLQLRVSLDITFAFILVRDMSEISGGRS